jgi:hypothetical protein
MLDDSVLALPCFVCSTVGPKSLDLDSTIRGVAQGTKIALGRTVATLPSAVSRSVKLEERKAAHIARKGDRWSVLWTFLRKRKGYASSPVLSARP